MPTGHEADRPHTATHTEPESQAQPWHTAHDATDPNYRLRDAADPNDRLRDVADPNDRLRGAVDASTTDTDQRRQERVPLPVDLTPVQDPDAAYSHTLAAKITAGAHIVATTTAEWIRLIAEFDERDGASFYFGINGTAHFLSVYCSTGTSTAREHVRVARSLATMPLIAAAFDAGRVSYSKVRECARIAGQVDESLLLQYAESLSAAQLEASIRTFRRTRRDRLEAEQLRTASWSTSHDGTVTLRAVLPAEEGARVIAALEKARDYLNSPSHAAPGGSNAPPGDEAGPDAPAGTPDDKPSAESGPGTPGESLTFTRADALLEVAASYLAHTPRDQSGADRDLVVVHVGASVLATPPSTIPTTSAGVSAPAGAHPDASLRTDIAAFADTRSDAEITPGSTPQAVDPHVCGIGGIGAISPASAQRIACDAMIQTITYDPEGQVIDFGRTKRFVTKAQRRALIARDSCCQFPGCGRTRNLDAHHIVHVRREARVFRSEVRDLRSPVVAAVG